MNDSFRAALDVATAHYLPESEFARKPAKDQKGFDFDLEPTPTGHHFDESKIHREKSAHDGKTPGEFAPGDSGTAEAHKPEPDSTTAPAGHRKWYGMSNRPPAIGAIPKGNYEHEPHPSFRHGKISYDRPLTEEEQSDYQLTPIHEDSDIPALAKHVGENLMGSYADKYADGDDKILSGKLKQEEIRKLGHFDHDKMKAEIRRQFGEKAESGDEAFDRINKAAASIADGIQASKNRSMLYQADAKEALAKKHGKPLNAYHNLPYDEWSDLTAADKGLPRQSANEHEVEMQKAGLSHMLTYSKFVSAVRKSEGRFEDNKTAHDMHRQYVQTAINAGATVPDNVRAEYPDLKPQKNKETEVGKPASDVSAGASAPKITTELESMAAKHEADRLKRAGKHEQESALRAAIAEYDAVANPSDPHYAAKQKALKDQDRERKSLERSEKKTNSKGAWLPPAIKSELQQKNIDRRNNLKTPADILAQFPSLADVPKVEENPRTDAKQLSKAVADIDHPSGKSWVGNKEFANYKVGENKISVPVSFTPPHLYDEAHRKLENVMHAIKDSNMRVARLSADGRGGLQAIVKNEVNGQIRVCDIDRSGHLKESEWQDQAPSASGLVLHDDDGEPRYEEPPKKSKKAKPQEFSRDCATNPRSCLIAAVHNALDAVGNYVHDQSVEDQIAADPSELDGHVAEVLKELANRDPGVKAALESYLTD